MTSMTMNGGTSLRAEGVIKRRAASNIGSLLSMTRAARPAVAAFFRMICGVKVPQSDPDRNRVDRPAAHH
jgi:hypothetical protein